MDELPLYKQALKETLEKLRDTEQKLSDYEKRLSNINNYVGSTRKIPLNIKYEIFKQSRL
jgi:hypothetical protein